MRNSFFKGSVLLALAFDLNGCSVLQDWFPDKEKDYQFTTELPPLVIPPDLAQKSPLPKRAAPVEFAAPKVEKAIETAAKAAVQEMETTPIQRPVLSETEIPKNEIQISLTHENVPTLNLNVPKNRAWRIIGKALSRSSIEVTKHDQESGQIYIQVADTKPPQSEQEKSFLDDTVSVFDGFIGNEQSYVLQFQETSGKTAVTVLNSELQPLKDNSSEKLLSSLFELIKSDLSK